MRSTRTEMLFVTSTKLASCVTQRFSTQGLAVTYGPGLEAISARPDQPIALRESLRSALTNALAPEGQSLAW
jgi:hypothetical protein